MNQRDILLAVVVVLLTTAASIAMWLVIVNAAPALIRGGP